ncbi:MAG: hypothetical protein GWN58_32780 [Anaerolineae bacterium]|nr:hypothetical protein [Thermoplasmata archaeon]NIV34051.1 hypothetical protein [Anaerolineae bacterium]NIY05902.1 hypothetical protein [Thermoplasmata archaeon]
MSSRPFIHPLLKALDKLHHREWYFPEGPTIEAYHYFERKGWVELRRPVRYAGWAVRLTPEGRKVCREPHIDGRRAHLYR